MKSLHVLVVNVIVRDDCGSKDCLSVFLNASVNHLFNRNGGSKVYAFDTPFFDTAVLDVDDFSHTYGVLVFAYCTANNLHVFVTFKLIIEFLVGHVVWFWRNFQSSKVDIEVNSTLELDSGTFSILHNLCGNNFRVNQTEFSAKLYGCSLCNSLFNREHHCKHYNSVATPLNFRSDNFARSVFSNLFKSYIYVIDIV